MFVGVLNGLAAMIVGGCCKYDASRVLSVAGSGENVSFKGRHALNGVGVSGIIMRLDSSNENDVRSTTEMFLFWRGDAFDAISVAGIRN